MTKEVAIGILGCAKAEVEWNYPLDYATAFDMAIQALQEPKRKKGQWIRKTPYGDFYCSICNENRPTYGAKLNYCPHCGADMRGEEE